MKGVSNMNLKNTIITISNKETGESAIYDLDEWYNDNKSDFESTFPNDTYDIDDFIIDMADVVKSDLELINKIEGRK